jgi:hypothetical protein
MREIKHTPGPWTNHGRITQPGLPHSAVAAETLIARVYSKYFGDTEQEIANANLIAAAPDLLAVLIELTDIEGPLPGDRDWHAKALAAIAKAAGTA